MWLPPPEPGTSVAGGFDGSENDDWTAIKLETKAGHIFTPRYGPDKRAAIWQPNKEPGGRIPRGQVHAAWAEIHDTYDLRRVYYDPGFHDETSWESEGEEWAVEFKRPDGEEVFFPFPTSSVTRFYPAIRRLESDLKWITHDGCPTTTTHMRNARKIMARTGRTYNLGKPAHTQKIDAAVTTVICHEAASDERAAGWLEEEAIDPTVFVFRR